MFSSQAQAASDQALDIVKKGPEAVSAMISAGQEHFPAGKSLSDVRAAFSALGEAGIAKNDTVSASLAFTMDTVFNVSDAFAVFDRYVALKIPKMEDGNNFGVTVQLTAVKHMKDCSEVLDKGMAELCGYAAARAEALSKCGSLPTTSTTKSESTSSSKSDSESASSDPEKKDGTSTSSKKDSSTDEKKTVTVGTSPGDDLRIAAVLSVDLLYYVKAKKLFEAAYTGYVSTLDFMDKNAQKIAAPKGDTGGHAFHSMY